MIVKAQNKFQVFNDLDGNPLNNGYVYMGTAGSNPETNPITVYSDSALTIPVAQPLRTIGGHIVVNGSRINVYTDGDYSITSRESDGSLIYSSLSGNIDAVQESAIQALADVTTASTTGVASVESAQATAEASVQTIVDSIAAQEAAITANTTELASIVSGVYTPTLGGLANVSSSTSNTAHYTRNGDIVTVSGYMEITATAATTTTQVSISLPVALIDSVVGFRRASGLLNSYQFDISGYIQSSTSQNYVVAYFKSVDTNPTAIHYMFTYKLTT